MQFHGNAAKILGRETIAEQNGVRVMRIIVSAPQIASRVLPGQFVVLMLSAQGERIPLTVVDKDTQAITLIFQEAGLTTKLLGKMVVGDALYALAGPLGHPTEIKNYGQVILVGGGVGIAEIYPVARALKEAGNQITVILGARTKNLLILEKELKAISDDFFVATDDGSYGKKGFVTDILKDLLDQRPPPKADPPSAETTNDQRLIYAVGPLPMMQRVSSVSKGSGVKTIVSLNALMVDGTGMCGCCRVSVAGKTRFSCIDGPEFDAHQVDFDELAKRNSVYREQEQHICRLHNLS